MDKNIIKDYLNKAFLTEAKNAKPKDNDGKTAKVKEEPKQEKKSAKGAQDVPGVKVTSKVNKESGKSNKEGVNAIAKDMKAYEAPLTKADANSSEIATNKFNYSTDEEKEYHDEMEIMNGLEMMQYDRTPDENYKKRALEAIEGSSKMGNNPDWANVVEKGWGGDKDFGKNLAKKIKASQEKRSKETPTTKMFGNDWEVIKDTSHKSYATESLKNKKSILKEALSEKAINQLTNKISQIGLRPTAMYLVDICISRMLGGLTASDLPDTTIYANGLDEIEDLLTSGEFDSAIHYAKEVANEMVEEEGGFGFDMDEQMGSSLPDSNETKYHVNVTGIDSDSFEAEVSTIENGMDKIYHIYGPLHNEEWDVDGGYEEDENGGKRPLDPQELEGILSNIQDDLWNEIANKAQSFDNDNFEPPSTHGEMSNQHRHDVRAKEWGGMDESTKTKQPLIKENKNKKQPMKRLKFKKEFNGVGNALKLIPESYRVDNKVFEMTDGNESYKVRWEGSLTEGAAVVLTASDKKMVNEDMDRMKALFNYKSQDTLGLLKGKARVDENASFRNIWDKTKQLLGEAEDIEGQKADAEGEWDDAGVTHAPEAKKHMVQASKMENGHQAPKPKEGIWSDIKPAHAADAKKHIQGSVSTDNGHQAPAPKQGHWDQIKIKGTTGVKGSTGTNVQSQAKKPTTGEFDSVKKHAPEASKNIQGSTSTDKGTKAPAPKKGDWDKVKKSAPEATKHVK